ncbi:testis-expressed protein 12-like [Centropristis striata]|uniref:testis-expressed protein 12-like n=1 Tax=Centropristis striata TaxID=184440 RepID=UPI0027E1D224|nr:testis-expressed protein 12-like [Centropristis striata]
MKKATPVAEKLIPITLNTRAVNNSKGPKQATTQETQGAPANQDKSPPRKRKTTSRPTTSILESADLFEATTTGGSREVNMLCSEFAEVLSERAAADTFQMKELEDILTEAQNLESYLKEKKKHLRQTLDLISDKLQG